MATFAFIDMSQINPIGRKFDILLEYGVIARNMIKGLGYAYTWYTGAFGSQPEQAIILPSAYMPPGQAWIDYLGLSVFGDGLAGIIAIFIINVAMSVASVYLIGRIAHELFENVRLTKITLWAAALYPPLIYTCATFGVTASVILLNSWILLSCIRFEKLASVAQALSLSSSQHTQQNGGKVSSRRRAIEIGIGFGLLFLFRGEAPLIFLVTIAYLLYRLRHQLRNALPKLALILIITSAIIAPWTIRNYVVFDRFILSSSNGGFNFWRGNNAFTAASSWTEKDGPLWTTDELWAKTLPYLDSGKLFEKKFSEIYFTDAMQWVREHPSDAGLLALKKAFLFWTFDKQNRMGTSIIYMSIYLMTLFLFALGLYRVIKKRLLSFGIRLIVLWCIMATIVAMMFFPQARLQVIMIATYFPIAVYGGMFLWMRLTRKKQVLKIH